MFIIPVVKKEDAKGAFKQLYKMIEKALGFVPPHFELFATINIEAMKEFMLYNQKMAQHPNINRDLLPHLRLKIATQECRNYCVTFNTNMLESGAFILSQREELLMAKVLKSLYETELFCESDLQELQMAGFNGKDFFDLLEYATSFMAKSKMIEVYLKKENL